jgi:hypothetical protein
MSFIRPELLWRIRRWREPIIWGALLGAGLVLSWRGLTGSNFLSLLAGTSAVATGGLLLHGAITRARLTGLPLGEGLVLVDEGRIVYFGPVHGGFVDLDDLVCVEVVPGGVAKWRLSGRDGDCLHIPFTSRGADMLPHALSALPGFSIPAGRDLTERPATRPLVVWRRTRLDPAEHGVTG